MTENNLNLNRLDKNGAIFILEAVFKASKNNALECSKELLKDGINVPWKVICAYASSCELSEILLHLTNISKASNDCDKVISVELDFDIFQHEYQHILDLFNPEWQYDKPREVLNKVIEFSEKFGVPRIKLRLLLEIAEYAEVFDSNDMDVISDVHDEVEETLQKMPSSVLDQANGGWFYARRVEALRDFIESW